MSENERVFRAVSVAGGEESNLTLERARNQVEAWESKGYSSYVEHMHDPEWTDAEIVAPITPFQVVDSYGADRAELEQFAFKLIELLGWETGEKQVDGFFVFTYEDK